MKIRIGTSGWNYPHWRGVFYPKGLGQRRWLSYYATYFDTVEVNATFYGTPKEKTFRAWAEAVPEGFVFAVKASRFITHIKRLREVAEALKRFYQSICPLKEKLGPILFQFPPSLKYDRTLMEDFLALLDRRYPTTIEIRNKSFWNPDFLDLLRQAGVALCLSDTAGKYPSLLEEITADFVYVRLHGSQELYRSCYTEEELKTWADKLRAWGLPGYVYFDNDAQGWAPINALHLKSLLY
jgi:uncharacterized protein YecE (DUF72 family)